MARRPKAKKRLKPTKVMWGRPRAYDDAEEFDAACQKYFATLKFNAPNIAGMCVAIGISRDTWENYRKNRKELFGTIKNAESLIEAWWVNRLKYPGAGAIFYLKNFKPNDFKDRTPGDSTNPLVMQITGMKISKEK